MGAAREGVHAFRPCLCRCVICYSSSSCAAIAVKVAFRLRAGRASGKRRPRRPRSRSRGQVQLATSLCEPWEGYERGLQPSEWTWERKRGRSTWAARCQPATLPSSPWSSLRLCFRTTCTRATASVSKLSHLASSPRALTIYVRQHPARPRLPPTVTRPPPPLAPSSSVEQP